MRWGLYVTLALALNLGLFQFMAGLIAYHRLGLREVVTAYRLDFVRLPPAAEPPPPPRPRLPPPEPKPVAAPRPPGPAAPVRGNVPRLPLPLPALKLEAPLATGPQVAVPPLPSLMVEGEPAPGPVRLPPAVPGYVPASELIPMVRIPPLYPPAARRRRLPPNQRRCHRWTGRRRPPMAGRWLWPATPPRSPPRTAYGCSSAISPLPANGGRWHIWRRHRRRRRISALPWPWSGLGSLSERRGAAISMARCIFTAAVPKAGGGSGP